MNTVTCLLRDLELQGHKVRVWDLAESNTWKMTAEDLQRQSFLNDFKPDFGGIIIDVGANLGLYSILASKLYPKAKIVALEPVPTTYALLQKNLEENGVTNVHPVNAALSVVDETIELGVHPMNAGAASQQAVGKAPQTVQVPALSYESLLNLVGIGVRPDLMKLDVEGMEYSILLDPGLGLGKNLWRPKALSVELHAFWQLPHSSNQRIMDHFEEELEDLFHHRVLDAVEIVWPTPTYRSIGDFNDFGTTIFRGRE